MYNTGEISSCWLKSLATRESAPPDIQIIFDFISNTVQHQRRGINTTKRDNSLIFPADRNFLIYSNQLFTGYEIKYDLEIRGSRFSNIMHCHL